MKSGPSPRRPLLDALEHILTGLLVGTVFALAFAGVLACIVSAVLRRLA